MPHHYPAEWRLTPDELRRYADEGLVRPALRLDAEALARLHDLLDATLAALPGRRPESIVCPHIAAMNGLDEALYRSGVGLLAYSPLGFGTLTGKYDGPGFDPAQPEIGRLARFESMRKQRWARADTLAAARLYNALAREHGLTPARLALAFCYGNWRVASTIIGVTSELQLEECLAAWGTTLSPELLQAIDAIRWQHRDPAQ